MARKTRKGNLFRSAMNSLKMSGKFLKNKTGNGLKFTKNTTGKAFKFTKNKTGNVLKFTKKTKLN